MPTITISKTVASAVRCSPRVMQTAAMFGLGVDDTRELAIVPPCEIPLPHLFGSSGIVFVTGPSGSGKSTILKLIAQRCADGDANDAVKVYEFDRLPQLPDAPLVDVFDWPGMTLEKAMGVLSMVGLGDAFVMLRRPGELSDGQRYRLRLAQVIAQTISDEESACGEHSDSEKQSNSGGADATDGDGKVGGAVILADEFGSTLDRLTAQTIARNIRRWIDQRTGVPLSFIVATTHDDLLEALEPDVLVWKGLGDQIEVVVR